MCNDTTHVIRTKTDCTTALTELGYQPLQDFYTGYETDVPSGCSVKINPNQSPPFKPHLIETSGKGKGHSDFIPICKGPGNTGEV